MRWNQVITLTTPGPDITFNQDAVADYYWLIASQCSGLGGAPIRRTKYDKPQDTGGIILPGLAGARPIILAGDVIAQSGMAAADTMLANLKAAVDSLYGATGTLTVGADDYTVYADVPYEPRDASFAPGSPWKGFIFGLIAANPVPS